MKSSQAFVFYNKKGPPVYSHGLVLCLASVYGYNYGSVPAYSLEIANLWILLLPAQFLLWQIARQPIRHKDRKVPEIHLTIAVQVALNRLSA